MNESQRMLQLKSQIAESYRKQIEMIGELQNALEDNEWLKLVNTTLQVALAEAEAKISLKFTLMRDEKYRSELKRKFDEEG